MTWSLDIDTPQRDMEDTLHHLRSCAERICYLSQKHPDLGREYRGVIDKAFSEVGAEYATILSDRIMADVRRSPA